MGPADPESSRTSIHRDCTSFHTDSWQTIGLVGFMASVIPSWVLTNLFLSEISSLRTQPGAVARAPLQSRGGRPRDLASFCIPPRKFPETPLVNPPVSPPERTIADLSAPTTACFRREARAGKAHAHVSGPFWGVGVSGELSGERYASFSPL